jgi:hypothetical protein
MAQGTRFLQDRAATQQALELANQVSIDRAARQLGVSKQALRRAFDHHGLPQPQGFQGGPQRTRFYQDREAAEEAWQRAAAVGINQTRKELGVSDRALRTAWRRHGLGLPPRPTAPARPQRLDAAFLSLNRRLLPARERSAEELAAWMRREEEYATLGAAVVVELNSESRTRRPTARAWAIIRRGQRGHHRQAERQNRGHRRQAERSGRSDRPSRAHQAQERGMVADAH